MYVWIQMSSIYYFLFFFVIFILKDEKQSLERRLAITEADLQQKLSSCQEVLVENAQITFCCIFFPLVSENCFGFLGD